MFSALNEEFVKCMIRQNKIISKERERERGKTEKDRGQNISRLGTYNILGKPVWEVPLR